MIIQDWRLSLVPRLLVHTKTVFIIGTECEVMACTELAIDRGFDAAPVRNAGVIVQISIGRIRAAVSIGAVIAVVIVIGADDQVCPRVEAAAILDVKESLIIGDSRSGVIEVGVEGSRGSIFLRLE